MYFIKIELKAETALDVYLFHEIELQEEVQDGGISIPYENLIIVLPLLTIQRFTP